MIKLALPKKPSKLTSEKEQELINEFISKQKAVWKFKYIYTPIRLSSFNKCCFSEVKLNTKSTYLEIDHFYPKNIYPKMVVKWGNLLPCSKKCNTSKGKTDTKATEIIHPYYDNPKNHLYFENFRLYPKNDSIKGKNTIEITALNDRNHFVTPRAEQTLEFLTKLHEFYTNFIKDEELITFSEIKKLQKINQLKGFLSDIHRKNEFSACISTAVFDSTDYKNIKRFLTNHNFWDVELQSYENEILFCYLGKYSHL